MHKLFDVFNGMEFDEEAHSYTYLGTPMSGITGIIGMYEKHTFPKGGKGEYKWLEAREEGSLIHRCIEMNLSDNATGEEIPPEAEYVLKYLKEKHPSAEVYSEVIVGDRRNYCSCIDILVRNGDEYYIYDIKTGKFLLASVKWQLGIYKKFLEDIGCKVVATAVISTKIPAVIPVIPRTSKECQELLDLYRSSL